MKIMDKLTSFIEQKIAPPLIKLSNLKYLQILQRTFICFTALLIIGSIFLLLAAMPIPAWQDLIADFKPKLAAASGVGTAFMAIFAVVAVSFSTIEYYNKQKKEKLDYLAPIVLAVSSYFLVVPAQTVSTVVEGSEQPGTFTGVPTDFLGAKGVFVALLVGIVTIEIYRFIVRKNWTIKMPEGVPPMVANAFIALVPSIFVIVFWWIIVVVIGLNLPSLVISIFSPLVSGSDTPWTVMLVTFLNRALWSVGIHGSSAIGAVAGPVWTQMTAMNQVAFEAGKDLPYMFTSLFYDNYIWTGLLPLAAIMCFSKSKRIRTLGFLALPAAVFNIGEPLIFGLPIMLNPILMIPFVLGYLFIAILAVILTMTGIIPVPVLSAPWIVPAPIKTLISTTGQTGSLNAVLFVIVSWVILALVFYPFLKTLEHRDLQEENRVETSLEEK